MILKGGIILDRFFSIKSSSSERLVNISFISELYIERFQTTQTPCYNIKLNNGEEYEISEQEYKKIKEVIEIF